jgi:hypothetical protein
MKIVRTSKIYYRLQQICGFILSLLHYVARLLPYGWTCQAEATLYQTAAVADGEA